jgi:hypothetical protein
MWGARGTTCMFRTEKSDNGIAAQVWVMEVHELAEVIEAHSAVTVGEYQLAWFAGIVRGGERQKDRAALKSVVARR